MGKHNFLPIRDTELGIELEDRSFRPSRDVAVTFKDEPEEHEPLTKTPQMTVTLANGTTISHAAAATILNPIIETILSGKAPNRGTVRSWLANLLSLMLFLGLIFGGTIFGFSIKLVGDNQVGYYENEVGYLAPGTYFQFPWNKQTFHTIDIGIEHLQLRDITAESREGDSIVIKTVTIIFNVTDVPAYVNAIKDNRGPSQFQQLLEIEVTNQILDEIKNLKTKTIENRSTLKTILQFNPYGVTVKSVRMTRPLAHDADELPKKSPRMKKMTTTTTETIPVQTTTHVPVPPPSTTTSTTSTTVPPSTTTSTTVPPSTTTSTTVPPSTTTSTTVPPSTTTSTTVPPSTTTTHVPVHDEPEEVVTDAQEVVTDAQPEDVATDAPSDVVTEAPSTEEPEIDEGFLNFINEGDIDIPAEDETDAPSE